MLRTTDEVDVYAGELEGLVIAEVEFPSEEAARAFPGDIVLAEEGMVREVGT